MAFHRNKSLIHGVVMSMRARLGSLAASALAAVCVAGAAAAETRAPACYPESAHGLQANAEARVYRRDGDVYGCAFAAGRRRLLGSVYAAGTSSSGGGGVTRLRLAGHYAAVVSVVEDSGRLAGITVHDLREARSVYRWDVGAGIAGIADDADITDVVLRSNGSVAFIEGVGGSAAGQSPKRLIVRRHDTRGSAILEDGQTIGASSLSLTGRQVGWTSGGSPRKATLR